MEDGLGLCKLDFEHGQEQVQLQLHDSHINSLAISAMDMVHAGTISIQQMHHHQPQRLNQAQLNND